MIIMPQMTTVETNPTEKRLNPSVDLLQETAKRIYIEFGKKVPDFRTFCSVLYAVGTEKGYWGNLIRHGQFEQDKTNPRKFITPLGIVRLQPQEAKVLEVLIKAQGTEVRARDLRSILGVPTIQTVRVYISSLRKRVDLKDYAGNWVYIVSQQGAGYSLTGPTYLDTILTLPEEKETS